MIDFKLKWAYSTKNGLVTKQAKEPYDTFQDAYRTIKAMHEFSGEPYELKKVQTGKGYSQFLNQRTGVNFVIFWTTGN